MRCRETILIAVLINLGLLAILFATARSVDVEEAIVASAPAPTLIEKSPPLPIALPTPIGRDEIDQALESYRRAEIVKPVEVAAAPPAPAPAPAVEPPPVNPKSIEIVVKKGDTLDKIARANGTTIERLIEVNGLKTTRLQIGQKLLLPADLGGKPPQLASVAAPAAGEEFYTVASGDNPWVIANKFRIPLDELLRINQLDETSAKRLKPGDRIRIK